MSTMNLFLCSLSSSLFLNGTVAHVCPCTAHVCPWAAWLCPLAAHICVISSCTVNTGNQKSQDNITNQLLTNISPNERSDIFIAKKRKICEYWLKVNY